MFVDRSDAEASQAPLAGLPQASFETIYSCYLEKVYQQCLSMTKDEQQAQDFTQDIFLKIFHKLDGFEQRSSFSTWLYAIANNYCIDQLRLAKRLPTSSLPASLNDELAEPIPDGLREEAQQRMRQALAQLSADERSLLQLKYEQGRSLDELAHLYGLKANTVKMRLSRIRQKLQRIYTQLG